MTKPKRIETAIHLRDHALSILRQLGSYQPIGDTKFLMWKGEAFSISHRTPFQKWDYGPEVAAKFLAAKHELSLDQAKYAATLHGIKLPEVLPYCLDIWRGGKVMSLEWADDGRAHIISFKRGPWEAEFPALPPEEAGAVTGA
jgi:hypothetical protein